MVEIAIASPMLPKKLALFGGIDAHRRFLNEAGYTGGLELHPMRGSMLARHHDSTDGRMRYALEAQPSKDNLPSGMSTLEAFKLLSKNLELFLET